MLISEEQIKQQRLISDKEAYMSKNLIIYYSRKGERDLRRMCKGASFGTGIAIHGADAAKSEKAVADWAKKVCGIE